MPDNISKFYDRLKLEAPLSPEEQEKKALEAGEEKGAAGGKKKKDAKKEKKAKKKKGGGDADGDDNAILKVGPTEVVQKFDEFYEHYTDTWANRDERDNKDQSYDK